MSAALRPISAADAGAMETWAAARAGVSLRPSPTIRTLRPAAASAAMRSTFAAGVTPARHGTSSDEATRCTGSR